MKNKDQHIHLGLSKEELELLVNNSDNQELFEQYADKLNNCDLSKSAIELISNDDLSAVSRIANEITNKYSTSNNLSLNKYISIGLISVILVIGSIFLFKDNSEPNIKVQKLPTQETKSNSVTEQDNKFKIEKQNETELIENEQSADITSSQTDSKTIIHQSENDTSTSDKIEEAKLEPDESLTKITTDKKTVTKEAKKIEFVATRESRKVRAIKAFSSVDPKYKNETYDLSSLVAYDGGNQLLEKELFSKLKDKVKDSDIPQRNSSVVFKFTVTPKGKVKEVNVQSITTPELEQIITDVTMNLTSWNKGSKRIPVDYTVYLTFK